MYGVGDAPTPPCSCPTQQEDAQGPPWVALVLIQSASAYQCRKTALQLQHTITHASSRLQTLHNTPTILSSLARVPMVSTLFLTLVV
jgi:hypothetical protein